MEKEYEVSIYNDEGKKVAEDIPVRAFHPLRNPYMKEIAWTLKRTAIINLRKIEMMLSEGRAGWTTGTGQDEIQMPWYGFDVDLVGNAGYIVDELKKMLQIEKEDDTEVKPIENGQILIVKVPKGRLIYGADYSATFTSTAVALGQIIAKLANLTPLEEPYKLGLLKNVLWGRYPQSITPQKGNPVSLMIKYPSALEGLGTGLKSTIINHLVALVDKRTLWGAALTTILEQLSQAEMGNNMGWYENYNLLGSVYQGFNANNMVLDLVKENRNGTVYSVLVSTLERAIEDKVIEVRGEGYPYVQPSGYKLYSPKDFLLWNAYALAGMMAAVIVNVGASRALQSAGAVLSFFSDVLAFEAGGLPDGDCGRVMGTALGYTFYTHGVFGGAGPGMFSLDHVLTRHSSGFFNPCIVAAACLDAGTQTFTPEISSGTYFILRKHLPEFDKPIDKAAEAAEKIKNEV
jgi:methyl-coenzyme M reductase beta subunit